MNFVSRTPIGITGLWLALLAGACSAPKDGSTLTERQKNRNEIPSIESDQTYEIKHINGGVADESVNINYAFVAFATDKVRNIEYAQTGPTRENAIETAMNLCNLRAGFNAEAPCVFVRVYRVNTLPRMEAQEIGTRWICFATENINPAAFKNRSWLGQDRTESLARTAAMKKCELKGGIDCRITRCSTADGEKIPY